MDFGVHLPLLDFSGRSFSLDHFLTYTETAEHLGYKTLAANDHLVFSRPWFDGPTALAAVLHKTGKMDLATTVSLPVIRTPAALAKTLSAIYRLSGGRLIAGLGPGSSARDYAAVGIAFEERWKRFDEALKSMRVIWGKDQGPFKGKYYDTESMSLGLDSTRSQGPPIWIGSWGSEAGLRRVVRMADGWLASGYNTTPQLFAEAWAKLRSQLSDAGRDADSFPNAIATMWLYVTEDRGKAERVLQDILIPTLNRPAEDLRERLPIGPAEECARKLAAYRDAGAHRILLWPLADDIDQITRFQERVVPLLTN